MPRLIARSYPGFPDPECRPGRKPMRGTPVLWRQDLVPMSTPSGSTNAAAGCGVSVDKRRVQQFARHTRTSISAGRLSVSNHVCCDSETKAHRVANRLSGPPQADADLRSHQAGFSFARDCQARRNSFSRAFCLLCTIRIGICCDPTLVLADSKPSRWTWPNRRLQLVAPQPVL